MSTASIQPLVRIGLYALSGYLAGAGLPEPAADLISTDPAVAAAVTDAVAAVLAGLVVVWWRVAQHLGWAT